MENQQITVGGQAFILRPPTDIEFHRFLDMRQQRGGRGRAASFLVLSCLASPSTVEAQAAFSDRPAIKHRLAHVLEEMAGVHDEGAPPLEVSEQIQDVLDSNPRAKALQLGGQIYVYSPPGEEAFDDFIALHGSEPAGALTNLVRGCLLYPEPKERDEVLGARPGHVVYLGGLLQQEAGADLEVIRGKPGTC